MHSTTTVAALTPRRVTLPAVAALLLAFALLAAACTDPGPTTDPDDDADTSETEADGGDVENHERDEGVADEEADDPDARFDDLPDGRDLDRHDPQLAADADVHLQDFFDRECALHRDPDPDRVDEIVSPISPLYETRTIELRTLAEEERRFVGGCPRVHEVHEIDYAYRDRLIVVATYAYDEPVAIVDHQDRELATLGTDPATQRFDLTLEPAGWALLYRQDLAPDEHPDPPPDPAG